MPRLYCKDCEFKTNSFSRLEFHVDSENHKYIDAKWNIEYEPITYTSDGKVSQQNFRKVEIE